MKFRKIILTLMLTLWAAAASARAPYLKFGIEWGPSAVLFCSQHLNYLDSEETRVIDDKSGGCFIPNGFVMGHVGINATNTLSVSVHSGYMGVGKNNRLIPVLLRLSLVPSGLDSDSIFFFADAGAGLHIGRRDQPERKAAFLADAGIGYRFALTPAANLEFALNLKLDVDNILIPNVDGGGYIPAENIISNRAEYLALCLSVGFTF